MTSTPNYRVRTSDPEARPSEVTKVPPTQSAEDRMIERIVEEVIRRLDAREVRRGIPTKRVGEG